MFRKQNLHSLRKLLRAQLILHGFQFLMSVKEIIKHDEI